MYRRLRLLMCVCGDSSWWWWVSDVKSSKQPPHTCQSTAWHGTAQSVGALVCVPHSVWMMRMFVSSNVRVQCSGGDTDRHRLTEAGRTHNLLLRLRLRLLMVVCLRVRSTQRLTESGGHVLMVSCREVASSFVSQSSELAGNQLPH
jgi:hypothetical protein